MNHHFVKSNDFIHLYIFLRLAQMLDDEFTRFLEVKVHEWLVDPRVVNQIWGEFQRARDRFVEVGKAETRIWLVIRQGTSARFPTILRTAGFLCGQIGGHYVPKLGLNCGSGNESGCSNAHIVSSNLFPHLLTGDLSISFFSR